MIGRDALAEQFEEQRPRLIGLAVRMLGSRAEAEDAVQEAWFRAARAETSDLQNLSAWLRTVVTRLCLDQLRSRRSRKECPSSQEVLDQLAARRTAGPEDQALLADEVSGALLVVLSTLTPAERVAFVLHDIFAVPFADIAPMLDRSPVAAKKLASRARQKVRGASTRSPAELAEHRRAVSDFLAAARAGDLSAVLTTLAPDVVRHVDPFILAPGMSAELRGARAVAEGTVLLAQRARLAELVLINGTVGAAVVRDGRLLLALTFTVTGCRISGYEVHAEPRRLAELDIALLDDPD